MTLQLENLSLTTM